MNLHLKDGEILGIIGPNGAGKTTFFNMLTGVHSVDEGSIVFLDNDITNKPVPDISRLGIGRTFQNIKLFESLTVVENVKIALYEKSEINLFNSILKTPKFNSEMERIDKEASNLLSMVGLKDKEDYLAGGLAYGEQRYLEIIRALATNPKLLILDEPGAGMNESEANKLVQHILDIRKSGHTVLLIEHDMNIIMRLCDRIYVINFGEKIAEGTPNEIRNNPDVIKAYLGEEEEDGTA